MRRDAPLAVFDVFVVATAYTIALVLRFNGSVPVGFRRSFLVVLPLLIVCHLAWNYLLGLYGQMWRHASILEARRVLISGTLGAASSVVVAVAAATRARGHAIPISVALIGASFTMLGFGSMRFQSRLFAFRRAGASDPERLPVLVMGVGDAGSSLVHELFTDRSLGLQPVALIDDDPTRIGLSVHGVAVQGTRERIPEIAARFGARQLLVAIPSASGELIRDVARICEESRLAMRVLPSLAELVGGAVSARDLRDVRIEDLLGRAQIELDLEAVGRLLHGRRVLITGAGGSIGSEIARQATSYGPAALLLLDHDETHLHEVVADLTTAMPLLADVRDRSRIVRLFLDHQPDVVFHAAAHKHVPLLEAHPQEALETNVLGTANVVDAAIACQAERFVMISTDKAIRPASVMGGSKRLAEEIVRSQSGRGTVLSAVRFGNVLGSRGSVVPTFVRQIRAGGPVTVTDPEMTRYFMSVREAVQLVLQASAIAGDGEVLTLDMGEPVKILDLAHRLIRLAGHVPDGDLHIVITGRRPGEKVHEDLVDPAEHPMPSGHARISVSRPASPPVPQLRRLVFEMEALARAEAFDDLAAALRTGLSARPPEVGVEEPAVLADVAGGV